MIHLNLEYLKSWRHISKASDVKGFAISMDTFFLDSDPLSQLLTSQRKLDKWAKTSKVT